ncbi:anion permease [Phytobacter ursingii]
MNSRLSKIVCLFLIIRLSLITLPPDGLSKEAGILASIYLAAIISLVSKPYPEPVIIIAVLAASCIAITHFSGSTIKPLDVVNGYSSGTT